MREPDWKTADGSVKLYCCHVHDGLQGLAPLSVHCCVTSPPYWALRSYLKSGDPLKQYELGSEPTPEAHVAAMVAVFGEVKRVLRDDGLLWVNYGDSYSCSPAGNFGPEMTKPGDGGAYRANKPKMDFGTLGSLQRVGIPERFALAMQAEDWIWRDTIVWHKKSPMPASLSGTAWVRCRVQVAGQNRGKEDYRNGAYGDRPQQDHDGKDFRASSQWTDCPGCSKCRDTDGYVLRRGSWRTTPAHEYIFLFAKKAGYFSDQEGVKEKCADSTIEREKYTRILDAPDEQFSVAHDHESISGGTRNPRSVMSFKAHNLKEKHYAAFPPGLPEFCIKASTSPEGCCPTCGAAWARVLAKSGGTLGHSWHDHKDDATVGHRGGNADHCRAAADGFESDYCVKTLGFRPTCSCPKADPVPCIVLDPFLGSGTTGIVAARLGHRFVGIELNPEYVAMATQRIQREVATTPLFNN